MFIKTFLIITLLVLGFSEIGNSQPCRFYGKSDRTGRRSDNKLFLLGGGEEPELFWTEFASSAGHGDLVILTASEGEDEYSSFMWKSGLYSSVVSCRFQSRNEASNKWMLEKIKQAEAIWITGGDQSNYMRFWANTPVSEMISKRIHQGITLGGTSAGLAIMGDQVFSARNGTAVSDAVLTDPFDGTVTIENRLFTNPMLEGILTDSHFTERSRLGRLIVFLSRVFDPKAPVMGLGIDESTALVISNFPEPFSVFGQGEVHLVKLLETPSVLIPSKPLSVGKITVDSFNSRGLTKRRYYGVKTGYLYEMESVDICSKK